MCDAHHHVFPDVARPPSDSRYLLTELLEDIGDLNVTKTVVVETAMMNAGKNAGAPVRETDLVEAIGRECEEKQGARIRVAAGFVGYVDLTLGETVAPLIEAHLATSDRLRGVRHIATWDESSDIFSAAPRHLLLDSRFREGFVCLGTYGLSFDALVYHPQLPDVVDLASAFPGTRIILEHTGCPLGAGIYAGEQQRAFDEWCENMAAVAACPNVVVKLGGLGMPTTGCDWSRRSTPPEAAEMAEAMAPYILYCIGMFGPDRCMFESNFPVEKVACSYPALWRAFEQVVADRTYEERMGLFYRTACSVYRV